MYTQLDPLTSGFGDRRITASTMPKAMPIAIAITVSSMVSTSPSSTRREKKYWPTTPQPKPFSVTRPCTNMAASTAMTTEATQRPGWRTGTALMSAGPAAGGTSGTPGVAGSGPGRSARRAIDHDASAGDAAFHHAPLGQDLLIDPLGHDGFHGGEDRGGHAARLGDGDAVGHYKERRAGQLEHPVRLLDDPGRNLGVGEAGVGPAAGYGQVGRVLGAVR